MSFDAEQRPRRQLPLEEVARAAGYRRTARVSDADELKGMPTIWFDAPGPSMLLVTVGRESVGSIGRVEPSPTEITARFRAACAQ